MEEIRETFKKTSESLCSAIFYLYRGFNLTSIRVLLSESVINHTWSFMKSDSKFDVKNFFKVLTVLTFSPHFFFGATPDFSVLPPSTVLLFSFHSLCGAKINIMTNEAALRRSNHLNEFVMQKQNTMINKLLQ